MRHGDQRIGNSVIPSRLTEKPPRPRWSRSPAYRTENRNSSVSPHDQLTFQTKDQVLLHTSSEEPADQFSDWASKLTKQISRPEEDVTDNKSEPESYTDSSKEALQGDKTLDDPNPDGPDLTAWIMQTSKLNVTASHPYSAPVTANMSAHDFTDLSFQRVRPEDDILTQWRLRRKMEQAHQATRSRRSAVNDHLAYPCTQFPLSDYHTVQSNCAYTCPTLPSKHSFWAVQPDHCCTGLRQHSPAVTTRDVDVQVNSNLHTVTALSVSDASAQTGKELCSPRPVSVKDACTLTDCVHRELCSKGTSTRLGRRSVGTTAYPNLRDASAQTPHRFIQVTRYECSLKQTSGQQKDPLRDSSNTIGAPTNLLNAMLGVTLASPKRSPFLCSAFGDAEDDDESVQTTEADSWQWQSTATATPDPAESVDLARAPFVLSKVTPGCDTNELADGKGNIPASVSSTLTHQSCMQPNQNNNSSLSNDGASNRHTACNGQLNESITRYLETIAHENQATLPWLSDPIVKDLHQRRDACLLQMKLVIEEIYKRELEVLDKARDKALLGEK